MNLFSDGTCRGCGGFRYAGHICPATNAPPPPEVDRLKARWDTAERAFDRVRGWTQNDERALVAGLLRDEQRRIDARMNELDHL